MLLSIQAPNIDNDRTTNEESTVADASVADLLSAVAKYKQSTDELFNYIGKNTHLYIHLLNQSPRTPIVQPKHNGLSYSYPAIVRTTTTTNTKTSNQYAEKFGIKFISMYNNPSPVMTNEVRGLVQRAYNDSEQLHKLSVIHEHQYGTYVTMAFVQSALQQPM